MAASSLLPEWSAFGLHPQLSRALHGQKFASPTPIQKETLPHALSGRDVIGVAETVCSAVFYAIVTGWQAIMKSTFPEAIDGDLVHLSNGFRVVPGARPLQAGDKCNAEARIVSITNTDAGKVGKVIGQVYRQGKPVIEVTSSFLYRGRFVDFDNTFEAIKHTDYEVELVDAAVGVL